MNIDSTHFPIRVALTGGIGSGKSTALAMFRARGAACLSSDHIVHQLLQRRDVRERVAARLGMGSLPAGEEGRRMLADVVFSEGDGKLSQLQEIMFPLVRDRIEQWFEAPEVVSTPVAVVEIPMLFEAGMEDLFERVILITAPTEVRRARHSGRVSRADFERRSAQQMPEAEKSSRCQIIYENTGSPDQLDKFVEQTLAALTGSGGAPVC